MRKRFIVALFVALVGAGDAASGQQLPRASPADVGLSPAALARIAPALEQYAESTQVAAIVAVVARHGKIAYVTTVSGRKSDGANPADLNAVFGIHSMTKPIVSAAIMQLYE